MPVVKSELMRWRCIPSNIICINSSELHTKLQICWTPETERMLNKATQQRRNPSQSNLHSSSLFIGHIHK